VSWRQHSPEDWISRLLPVLAAAALCVVSFLEHGRNVAPSTVLTIYLVFTIFSDVIHAGLLVVARNLCDPLGLDAAIFAVKFVLLVLEGQTKLSILREPYQKLSPEETSGFFGVIFFWWVNRFLKLGYNKVLSLDDMPQMMKSIDAAEMRELIQRKWDRRRKHSRASPLSYGRWVLFLSC